MTDIEKWTDKRLHCPPSGDFTPDQTCIIRALQHIASCISAFTHLDDSGTYNKMLAFYAFKMLLPEGRWRKGGVDFVNTVSKHYRTSMIKENINEFLKERFGINHDISKIYKSLASSHYDCEKFCPSRQSCEGAMVIFAAALGYLDDFINLPTNDQLRRRIRALAVLEPQTEIYKYHYEPDVSDSSESDVSESSDEPSPDVSQKKKKQKLTHRDIDTRDRRFIIYYSLLGNIPEIEDQYNSITRKLEDMNPTSRLKTLNRLTKMTRDEKVEYIDNIKSMNTYLKEDLDTHKKREKIYIKLILNIGTALMDYIDITKDLEGFDEDVRLKILNKWYNLGEADRKKDIRRMLLQ